MRHRRVDGTCLKPAEQLECGARILARHLAGPLAARLGLEAVRLVDDPMADGREDAAVGVDVAQQERVVGHHHVSRRCAAARAMHEAGMRVERAALLLALVRRAREQGARNGAPADAERVEVALGRLAREGQRDGERVEHVRRDRVVAAPVGGDEPDRQVLGAGALDAREARVVIVALEREERDAAGDDPVERGELMGDELVGECVGLGGDAHRQVVALGEEDLGQQVGDRLAHARARLERTVRRGRDGVAHLARHGELLGPALVGLVHPAHAAVQLERRVDLLARGHDRRMPQLRGILARGDVDRLDELLAAHLEREAQRVRRPRERGEDRTV